MRRRFVLAFVAASAVLSYVMATAGSETRDAAAVTVAHKTMGAMGGEQAFAGLRTLKFDFVVERGGKEVARFSHVWDRHDGRYRVEGKNKEGKTFLTLFNINKPKEGRAWLDGKALAGNDLAKALEHGYGRFINDSYWLLMPAKMMDPGVNLVSEKEAEEGGKKYDVVRVTFGENVGLTPKDTYWAYVSRDSGLMERWDFVLQGQEAKDRSTFLWQDWQDIGSGVRLALSKKTPDGTTVIRFDRVSGSTAADDAAFAAP